MADVSVQFHASLEELLEFSERIIAAYGLRAVALRHDRPFEAHEVYGDQLERCFREDSHYKRLHFTLGEPVLPATDELDFQDKNPDSLRLDIGTPGKTGVMESWLSARTANRAAIAVWNKVAKQLKSITVPGATAINPKTGAIGPAKWHRFTEGAKRLDAGGTPLISLTGIILKPGLPVMKKPIDG